MSKAFAFCLCADDYAMTLGVSRGILEGLAAGALTATSVMTTSPYWPDTAAALRPHALRADIGLHINLTVGAPLGRMPGLAPDGRLPDLSRLMRLARGRNLPIGEIVDEIDRQCEAFSTVFGRPPDHVDGHQHVHVLAAIRPLVFDCLARRGWHPWLRSSADRLHRLVWRAGRKKALALAVLADGFEKDAADRGFVTNQGFAGFSTFDPTAPYGPQFETYLRAPGTRHLIMCHPGYVDDALRQLDPVVETREQELRYLTSHFLDFANRQKATLTRMSVMIGEPLSAREEDIRLGQDR